MVGLRLFNKKQSGLANSFKSGLTVSSRFLKDTKLNSDFILGTIDDGVVMVDRGQVIHVFNKAAGDITGWAPNEAVGLDFNKVIQLIDGQGAPVRPEEHPFIQALVEGKPVRTSDLTLNSKNGKQIAVSIIVSPVINEPGEPAETAIAVFRDISIEKRQEEQRTDFISTASHEMRTPITAIEGYLSLSLNEKTATIDDNARNYLSKAQDATKHLGQLFQDLLTSSKADDGRLQSNPTVVEIGEIVEEIAEQEKFKAEEKGLELKFMVSSDKDVSGAKVVRPFYYSFVDPIRMNEVIQNLIDNAIKYTPEGTITVRLTGDSQTIQIQIQDTGSGIPSEDIPHLFQKFYRVDNSATRTIGGTGLGLYICKRIVELYKGRVWVESSLGHGSTFFVNLPRLTSEQALQMQRNQSSIISPNIS